MKEQIRLFEIIKSKIPNHSSLADEIEDILGVSKESVYRRIRGQKLLSFKELKNICDKYILSIDDIFNSSSEKSILFQYKKNTLVDINNYAIYMKQLLESINNVAKSSSEKNLIFSAQDIPFYHFCKYPDLAFFKLYTWNTDLKCNNASFEKFCATFEKNKIVDIYEQIFQAYLCIPSIEVWTEQTVDITLRLMEYYFDAGKFDSKDTLLFLLDRFSDLIDTIRLFADEGHKNFERKIPFSLFSCSVDMENCFMLLKKGEQLMCFLKLYSFNIIITDNELLCADHKKWIDSLISKSILISGDGAFKERFQFFNKLKSKILTLTQKVSNHYK